MNSLELQYIYIYAFGRCFYPNWLVHLRYNTGLKFGVCLIDLLMFLKGVSYSHKGCICLIKNILIFWYVTFLIYMKFWYIF